MPLASLTPPVSVLLHVRCGPKPEFEELHQAIRGNFQIGLRELFQVFWQETRGYSFVASRDR